MPTFPQFLYRQLFVSLPYPATPATGKTVLITGSNTGLGKEAARHYARLGAKRLILAVRNVSKGEAAKADILASTKIVNPDIEILVWHLDMASYSSVQQFAARVDKEVDRLDIAILNAGVAKMTFDIVDTKEADGQEETIVVNVISTMLLSLLLLPKLKASTKDYWNTHLTIVSSETHFWTSFFEKSAPEGRLFEEFKVPKDNMMKAQRYWVSKLLEVYCVKALAERMGQKGVILNTVNPGMCHSDLTRAAPLAMRIFKLVFARTTEAGSRTLVHAGLAGPETHGCYLSDCHIEEAAPLVTGPGGRELQERVWTELGTELEKSFRALRRTFEGLNVQLFLSSESVLCPAIEIREHLLRNGANQNR